MTTKVHVFLLKILTFAVGIFLLNLCYQHFVISDFFITKISKVLFEASRHAPAQAFKPMRIAQGLKLESFKSDNVIAGTSITQNLFFGLTDANSGYRFVTVPESQPYMFYFYLADILEQPTQKIKLIVTVPHFVHHRNNQELQFSMPPRTRDTFSFLDKIPDWKEELEILNYNFALRDLSLTKQFLLERLFFRYNAFSNVPGLIVESNLRENLPKQTPQSFDLKGQGSPQSLVLNYKIIDFMMERLAGQNIKFYIIEDRSRTDCEQAQYPAIRESFIQLNKNLEAKHENFVFIPRERLPIIDDVNYRDCLHVKVGRAPWKQKKINFIRDL